jgi:Mrp family chromosome partitioning ATPase
LLPTKSGSVKSVNPTDIQGMHEPLLRSAEELSKLKVISATMHDERILNAFREIRTSILRNINGNDSVILIASTDRDAGASFVALNLAAAFSLEEDKTSLVVDCDVRSPSFDKFIVHDGLARGLRDYLTTPGIDVADIIYPSGIPRLRIIPAGTDGVPLGEYFTTPKLRDLFTEIRSRYPERYIFIDAPPVSNSPDARILADVCDHVILVVPYGKATEAQIGAVIDAIGEDKLLGVIFNNAPQYPRLR